MSADENTVKVVSLTKKARSHQMDVLHAAYSMIEIPDLAPKILEPRVERLCVAIEDLASIMKSPASEALKEGVTGLRIVMADLEGSPSRERVDAIGMRVNAINLGIGSAFEPTG